MAEGVSSLTFPMSRESESASRLKAIISDMLPLFTDVYTEDVLSEYITMLVCNGKSQRQAREDLEAFLREESWEFVACLWEVLLNNFSQGKQESSASDEHKTAVDFGSHDPLIEQGSCSRRHNDYDEKVTNATYLMNGKPISATAPIEDIEAHVSPKVRSMKMLRQELINSPCKRTQPKQKDDWNLSGYSRKLLRSVVVSGIKQPRRMNPDQYEKSMDERSRILQDFPYLPERKMRQPQSVHSGRALSARSRSAASRQEISPHVSVWDRLGRPSSKLVCDKEGPTISKFGIQGDENKVLPWTRHRARQPKSGTITSTEPHIAYNLSRKRRYGLIDPNSEDSPVCEFSSFLQQKKPVQDVERPSPLSSQSAKPDLFSEIRDMKQKLQQLETQISQAKQLKKQKVGELKRLPQSDELQCQQDGEETRIIHVTNVHYATSKEAVSMLFSKCGAVENVTVVTDPVTRHPKGAAFVTFATKESVDKAIALNNTMFYSRPIKVRRHMVASGVMSETQEPQVV